MKKFINFLRKIGLLHAGKGDFYTGGIDNSFKKEKSIEDNSEKKVTHKSKKRNFLFILTTIILLSTLLLFFVSVGFTFYFFLITIVYFVFIFYARKWWLAGTFYFWKALLGIVILLIFGLITIDDIDLEGSQDEDSQQEAVITAGEIYILGGDGDLTKGGDMSYVGTSARGEEAYLAERGATSFYEFDVSNSGEYTLFVKLSDDGLHFDGFRSATITINEEQVFSYSHVSENTDGWKWYEIGLVELKEGGNQAKFEKNETTSAAYVMEAFKFVPNF